MLLVVALFLAACSNAAPSGPTFAADGPASTATSSDPSNSAGATADTTVDADRFLGRTYRVDAATENGKAVALVADDRPWIRFTDEAHFVAYAGCNGIGGNYQLRDGHLVTSDVGVAYAICDDPPIMQQESWYVLFLASDPAVGWEASALVLSTDDAVVTLTTSSPT
ncbi:MAG TPA: META domain-containing protein [Candidatus Limnocylindrales bacterium]|nr:META domain-containing protein [Candidatus Limnocylindrales bacterium]